MRISDWSSDVCSSDLHVSENLGQVEQVEANEGMSYGVNDMRDGVNLSRMQVTRPLVMHTEVTNLPNLMGYLRFGRSLPVVRFEDSYNKVASIGEAFEERGNALRSEEHTSELQSLMRKSYAVFCLKQKN